MRRENGPKIYLSPSRGDIQRCMAGARPSPSTPAYDIFLVDLLTQKPDIDVTETKEGIFWRPRDQADISTLLLWAQAVCMGCEFVERALTLRLSDHA